MEKDTNITRCRWPAPYTRPRRRVEALQVIVHQLNLLDQHLRRSSRIINDLRTLRRMLLGERQTAATELPEPAERPT